MSDTNKISIEFSKDFQPLIETAFDDIRQYFKDKAQNELVIEQAKIKASKEKFDAALKMLNKNGAVDKLMLQAANKLMAVPEVSPKINKPASKFDENSKVTRAEKTSLISLITKLNEHLDSDPEFKMALSSVISQTSVGKSIHDLLKSTSEDNARLTLKYIKFNISADDLHFLIKLNDALNSSEKELVEKMINFET
mgnify:FL=1